MTLTGVERMSESNVHARQTLVQRSLNADLKAKVSESRPPVRSLLTREKRENWTVYSIYNLFLIILVAPILIL